MSSLQSHLVPSLDDLAEEFQIIKNSSLVGVPGIMLFDSGIPGPCVGITIHTHGNEPSGLAALRQFRQSGMQSRLLNGSVLFILNNIAATEKYFAALKETDSQLRESKKLAARFVDINMNRLPKNLVELENPSESEILRAKELLWFWKTLDYLLDIHSTRSASPPMIIAIGETGQELYRRFPAEMVIRGIERVQTGKPACAFSAAAGKAQAFGIEAGSHEEASAFAIANACVLSFLQNLGLLPGERSEGKRTYKEYLINGSVFFPDESYELAKVFRNFECLEKGDVIAVGNGEPIVSSSAGHAVFTPPGRKHTSTLNDEVMFLSAPVKKVMV
jgi:succinylglutamate desuccinylase